METLTTLKGVYRKEIKLWPQIGNGGGESCQKFFNFLLKCESITQTREWNPLDTPDLIYMFLSKLPGVKWVRVVMNVMIEKEREATLRDFIGFIKEETDLMNDPLFSKSAIDQYQEKKSTKNEHPKKRLSSYTVKSKNNQKDDQQRKETCLVCGKGHLIDHCKEFIEKSPKERIKILTKGKLCFGCYQPMTENHNANSCKQQLVYRLCFELHPTGMHEYMKRKTNEDHDNVQRRESETDTVKCASVNGKRDVDVISMCIVAAWVGHKSSRKMVKTYAMLDNCRQVSFIKKEINEELGITGRKLKLILKILTGEKSEELAAANVSIVSGISCGKEGPVEWIEVPKAYSRSFLPVKREDIATPKKIKKWKYLNLITAEITRDDDIEVGMLIGTNCMKALEPVETIDNQDEGSFAYKSKLGWFIIGPIVSNKDGEALSCNGVAVKDANTGKLLPHHFVKDSGYKMRGVGVEEMFRKIYQNDFCEEVHLSTRGILEDIEEISKDDKMFLAIVEKGTKKVADHYEVPLPYRDGNLQLPNSYEQAIRRMQ